MQYVQFGQTGAKVSRLCLGTMTFSRYVDFDLASRIVDDAIANGINFIDTAESYGDSESFLGRILRGKRDKIFLATKVFTKRANHGNAPRNSRDNITESLHNSLRRLQTDHIDLYQLHHPDPDARIEETLQCLDDLQRQGKIRFIGVSNHYAWQMAYMIALAAHHQWRQVVSIQCRYNILDRIVEVETVPMARKFDLAMMAYAPLCGGLLTGKYHRHETPTEDQRAASDKKLTALLQNDKAFDVIDQLNSIARRNNLELNQLAILWLMSKSYCTTPTIGGSKPEHFRSLIQVADRTLSEHDAKEIDEISSGFIYRRFENQPYFDAPII